MPVPPMDDALISSAEDDEAPILDAIRKWLDRDVRHRVLELERGDIYPAAMVEQMKALGLFGATIAPRTAASASRLDLCPHRHADLRGLDRAAGRLQHPPDHGGRGRALRHRGPEAAVPAALRHGRAARRPGADRSGWRHRPAGDPHPRRARRRPLRDQWRQDLDHERHRGPCFALLVKTDPGPNRATAACRCSSPRRGRAFGSGASSTSSATTAAIPPSCSSRTTACPPIA